VRQRIFSQSLSEKYENSFLGQGQGCKHRPYHTFFWILQVSRFQVIKKRFSKKMGIANFNSDSSIICFTLASRQTTLRQYVRSIMQVYVLRVSCMIRSSYGTSSQVGSVYILPGIGWCTGNDAYLTHSLVGKQLAIYSSNIGLFWAFWDYCAIKWHSPSL